MKKHFYSHLIEVETIHVALDELELETGEKKELVEIMESSIHHVVVDTVLDELSGEDKKKFLAHIAAENHDELWNLLNTKIKKPEQKIKKAVDELKTHLHKDIKKAKKLKK